MKKQHKWFFAVAAGLTLTSVVSTSCVDDIKFGSAFLEKAPGGDVTSDTVFNSPEYVRQFLNTLYTFQYYGLPFRNSSSDAYPCESSNPFVGKPEALTDCYTFTYLSAGIVTSYYLGTHTSNYGQRSDKWDYLKNRVWQAVRYGYLLIENIDRVPGMEESEKASIVAQAKCIIASRYFDTFRHYGGLPIIDHAFSGTDASYDLPRATVEETVNFMVKLLDEAAEVLPWTVDNPQVNAGHWTRAAAMALKCRILQFAASPLFNDDVAYAGGSSEAEAQHLVWYGGYRQELWTQCLQACEEFFNELNANGGYSLVQANGTRPEDYRLAYRTSYAELDSPEILLSTRQFGYDAFKSGNYTWHSWGDPLGSDANTRNGVRRGYSPTQEYVEMFPWADGTPFDWDKTAAEGRLDEMFMNGSPNGGEDGKSNIVLTRDPRLYEEAVVNGLPTSLDWTTGNMSGRSFEAWVGGFDAQQEADNQTGSFATGYAPMKYLMGPDMLRHYTQWVVLRLSDMYLTYAEALCQNNRLADAIAQIDIVRARVGMKGLAECNPEKNLTGNKDALIEEILRERACELGMEDTRFFDLIRYKRADIFEKQLHGLRIIGTGEFKNASWYSKGDPTLPYPTHFEYEKYELSNPVRYWWTNGFDPKWYLSPFPLTEVNKAYGLIQNPGW